MAPKERSLGKKLLIAAFPCLLISGFCMFAYLLLAFNTDAQGAVIGLLFAPFIGFGAFVFLTMNVWGVVLARHGWSRRAASDAAVRRRAWLSIVIALLLVLPWILIVAYELAGWFYNAFFK